MLNLFNIGIWSYHAKLYHDSVFPDTKMTVDVVTKSHSSAGIGVTITASHTAMQVSKRFLRASYSIELLLLSVAWHYSEGLIMQTCHNSWPGLRHKCTSSKN